MSDEAHIFKGLFWGNAHGQVFTKISTPQSMKIYISNVDDFAAVAVYITY